MQKYNCIIVEDESIAAELLQDYVKQVPFLNLKGVCIDAIYALEMLQKEHIDLVFLDINLPKLKGLDFIRTLKNPPKIIITSAYHEYALQGYELNVVDYLLKPIEFSRFLMAVNKIKSERQEPMPLKADLLIDRDHLFFNVSKKLVKIYLDEILIIESLREYIRITTQSKTILTKIQISEVETLLPPHEFIRIHRSFIIAKRKIESFSSSEVEINKKQIPIGRHYKDQVLAQFKLAY